MKINGRQGLGVMHNSYIKCSDIVRGGGGWRGGECVAVTETKPDSKVRGDIYKTLQIHQENDQKVMGDKWGWKVSKKTRSMLVLPWGMSGVMPTLCSRASASLLFLSRSESSWPAEEPPPDSAPRFESPCRAQDRIKTKQRPGRFFSYTWKCKRSTYILLLLLLFFSLLLLSNLSDPLFLPLQLSLQLTLVRHTAGGETLQRLFEKCSTARFCFSPLNVEQLFDFTLFHIFAHNKMPWPGP